MGLVNAHAMDQLAGNDADRKRPAAAPASSSSATSSISGGHSSSHASLFLAASLLNNANGGRYAACSGTNNATTSASGAPSSWAASLVNKNQEEDADNLEELRNKRARMSLEDVNRNATHAPLAAARQQQQQQQQDLMRLPAAGGGLALAAARAGLFSTNNIHSNGIRALEGGGGGAPPFASAASSTWHQQLFQQPPSLTSLQLLRSIQDAPSQQQQALVLSQLQQQQRQEWLLAGLGWPSSSSSSPPALPLFRQQQTIPQELQQLLLQRLQQNPRALPAQFSALSGNPVVTPRTSSQRNDSRWLSAPPQDSATSSSAAAVPPRSSNHLPLGISQDRNWITDYHCFVRSELLIVFQASSTEVAIRSPNKALTLGQIGLCCRYCADLKCMRKAKRSTAFPSSIRQIYQSFTMMLRDHFADCPALPPAMEQQFLELKAHNSQGASDSKQYWIYAAQKIGMQDTPDAGIVMTEDTQRAARSMLPYGVTSDEMVEQILQSPKTPLVSNPSLCPSPFLYELLQHLQQVHLLSSELVGKRKVLPEGMSGLGCRYCCQECRLGFSRVFPLRRQSFPGKVLDLYVHLRRCNLCPAEVRMRLANLYAKENPKELQKGDKHQELYDELWTTLLARKGDDFTKG